MARNVSASFGSLRQLLVGVSGAGLLLLFSSGGQAAPLGLTLLDTPDIASFFISVDYNAGTDAFTASGSALLLDDDGSVPPEDIVGGTFDLSASIDASGVLSNGTLAIGGTVGSLGFIGGTLLTGDLTAFGFPAAGGDPLEFLFTVTGGDAAGLYGGVGSIGGIILSGGTGFTGDFSNNFTGSGSAVADAAPPVPLPAAVWLFGAGLLALVGVGRNRVRG